MKYTISSSQYKTSSSAIAETAREAELQGRLVMAKSGRL